MFSRAVSVEIKLKSWKMIPTLRPRPCRIAPETASLDEDWGPVPGDGCGLSLRSFESGNVFHALIGAAPFQHPMVLSGDQTLSRQGG